MKLKQDGNTIITSQGEILENENWPVLAVGKALQELQDEGADILVEKDGLRTEVHLNFGMHFPRVPGTNMKGSVWRQVNMYLKSFSSPSCAAAWLRENEVKVKSVYRPSLPQKGDTEFLLNLLEHMNQ